MTDITNTNTTEQPRPEGVFKVNDLVIVGGERSGFVARVTASRE